jgi:hypothetical protein
MAVLEQRPAAAAPGRVPIGKRSLAASGHGTATALSLLKPGFHAAHAPRPRPPSAAAARTVVCRQLGVPDGGPCLEQAGAECWAGRARLTPAGCGHTRRTPPPACRASATGARGAHAKHHSPPDAVPATRRCALSARQATSAGAPGGGRVRILSGPACGSAAQACGAAAGAPAAAGAKSWTQILPARSSPGPMHHPQAVAAVSVKFWTGRSLDTADMLLDIC